MKTFAATFALIGFTSAIGISQDETAGLDLADLGNVMRVAQHICIDGDADGYPAEKEAVDHAAGQLETTAGQVCDDALDELGEGDDLAELAQTGTQFFGGLAVAALSFACKLAKC